MMNSTIPLWINGRTRQLNADALEALCPGFYHDLWNGSVSFETIVHQIENTVHAATNSPIKRATIIKVLERIFEATESRFSLFASRPEKRIRRKVEDRLTDDLESRQPEGLRPSRHTFLIVCAFAKVALSQPIANEMATFMRTHSHKISAYESDFNLRDWQMGLRALQELSVDQATHGPGALAAWPPTPPLLPLMLAPHHSPFETYHRGRSPLRLPHPRPHSLVHGRSHGFHLALPRLSNTAWTSPILSPGSFHDELGQLKYQQEEMNWKLDDIGGKLDHLVR